MKMAKSNVTHPEKGQESTTSAGASLISTLGYVLAVSYPVLALSTGVRALYQLFFKEGVTDYLPVYLTLAAATLYLIATLGFAYRRPWTWWLSLISLGVETMLTLIVGTWSFINPELIGHTVWRHFGADYGYFPLFQPIIGLIWLVWPATRAIYGVGPHTRQDHVEPTSPRDS
jgi:hypothetical protein